jgi:hypothetical protein
MDAKKHIKNQNKKNNSNKLKKWLAKCLAKRIKFNERAFNQRYVCNRIQFGYNLIYVEE